MTVASGFDFGQCRIGIDVAGASAILQLHHGVFHRGGTGVLGVRITLVLTCMTTRAIRSISRVFPGCRVSVGGVTTLAGEIERTVVITWIFAGCVFERQWCPRSCAVTDIALARSSHVPAGLAGRRRTVVANTATASDSSMTERGWLPRQC